VLAQGETRWSTPLAENVTIPRFARRIAEALARAILAGDQDAEAVAFRMAETLGRRWRWAIHLAHRYVTAFAGKVRPRRRELVDFLLRDRGFCRACVRHHGKLVVANRVVGEAAMRPVEAARRWPVPAIATVDDLAAWCGLKTGEVEWFADLKGISDRFGQRPELRHYNYRTSPKRSGGVRVIESPKPRLKELQRQVLAWILDKAPVHPAAHGFVRGRSIKSFAAPHTGQDVVLRMDLKDFFPSIRGARVQTFFRTLGYPEPVADLLGGICVASLPRDVWTGTPSILSPSDLREAQQFYGRTHLPQGAPTSPALANLCAHRLDCRLTAFAEACGARYTRYADDLAFSGGEIFAKSVDRFATQVAAILLEEGFAANHRKTRIMRQGGRQHLAGVIVNRQVNIQRSEFDELKAILHNCVHFGSDTQNRERHPAYREHLLGKIGFVEMVNPAKGARLRRSFAKIRWD